MKGDYVPIELLGKFDSLVEAAAALSKWKRENRGPGRPRTRDCGVSTKTLKKMLKAE